MTMAALAQHVSKRTLEAHTRFITLEVSAVNDNGDSVDVPYIRYSLAGAELALASAGGAAGAGAGAGAAQ